MVKFPEQNTVLGAAPQAPEVEEVARNLLAHLAGQVPDQVLLFLRTGLVMGAAGPAHHRVQEMVEVPLARELDAAGDLLGACHLDLEEVPASFVRLFLVLGQQASMGAEVGRMVAPLVEGHCPGRHRN